MTRTLALSGTYPRREDLVKTTWDVDKGLADPKALDAKRLECARELVALEERLGAGCATDGNLTWQDAMRGLVESASGLEVGGVTRLFETNRFYRQPLLKAEPRLDAKKIAGHFLLDQVKTRLPKRAILPSPYWLTRAAKIESGEDGAAAGPKLARLVHEAAQWLQGKGYAEVQFQEPLLFYEKEPDLPFARDLFGIASKGLKVRTIANFPNGDAGPHLAWVAKLPVTGVGLDFVETHVEAIKSPPKIPYLQAAVVDSQESLLEAPRDVGALVEAIEKRFRPGQLTLTHTWDLQFVPTPVAVKKLEVLSQVLPQAVAA